MGLSCNLNEVKNAGFVPLWERSRFSLFLEEHRIFEAGEAPYLARMGQATERMNERLRAGTLIWGGPIP